MGRASRSSEPELEEGEPGAQTLLVEGGGLNPSPMGEPELKPAGRKSRSSAVSSAELKPPWGRWTRGAGALRRTEETSG